MFQGSEYSIELVIIPRYIIDLTAQIVEWTQITVSYRSDG